MPILPIGYVRERSLFPTPLPAVLALSAPAGYGKSSALVHLQETTCLPTLWYQLDAADADIATFFTYLLAGLRAHAPYAGRAVAALLVGEPSAVTLAAAFLVDLEEACLPGLLIVLDDLHTLEAAHPALAAIAFWLDKLPKGIHLALLSRHRLPFAFARLKARGLACELNDTALALDASESAAFWVLRGGLPGAIAARASALAGWPLGLELLATDRSVGVDREVTNDPAAAGSRAPTSATSADLLGALYEEALAALNPEALLWLERCALFESQDASLATAVFGEPPPPAVLELLIHRHLLVPLAGEPRAYRLPPLLKELLAFALEGRYGRARLREWHAAAGTYLAPQAPELALAHLLKAGLELQALELAEQAFPALWAGGRRDAIARWVADLSSARGDEHPTALRWRGRLAERAGDLADAERLYRQAETRADFAGDLAGRFAALARLGSLQASRGDDIGLAATLEAALPLALGARGGDRCDLLLAQALIAERHGSPVAAAAYHNEVLAEPATDDPDVIHAHGVALLNLAGDAVNRGEDAAARGLLARLLTLVEDRGLADLHAPARIYEAVLAAQDGDWPAVEAALSAFGACFEHEMAWQDAGLARELAASLAIAKSDWPQAKGHLAAATAIYGRAQYAQGLLGVAEAQIRLAGRQGLFEQASRHYEALGPLRADDAHHLQPMLAFATVLLVSKQDEAAGQLLNVWLPNIPAEQHRMRARAELLGACAAHDTRKLRQVVAEITSKGYGALLLEEPALVPLFAPALAQPGPEPTPPAQTPNAEVATPLVGEPGLAPVERLAFHCFGSFEVLQGGAPRTAFGRGKARILLAALALYPRGVHRIELATMLYGEEPAAEQNLRSVVSALRKALEPNLPARAPSRYLHLEDERYVLLPGVVEACDLAAFDSSVADAERAFAVQDERAYEAATRALQAVYRGNLLEEPAFDAYFVLERESFRQRARHEFRRLGLYHLEAGRPRAALVALNRLVALDPLDEGPALLLIRAHMALGAPELARFVYWDLRNRLKRLDEKPSDDFERAYREAQG